MAHTNFPLCMGRLLSVTANSNPCDNLTLSLTVSTFEHRDDSNMGLSQRTIVYCAAVLWQKKKKNPFSPLIFIQISQFMNSSIKQE